MLPVKERSLPDDERLQHRQGIPSARVQGEAKGLRLRSCVAGGCKP
jgi:hypothetical protein